MKKLLINKENLNGIYVDLTAEDLAQREKDIENAATEKTNEQTEKENMDNLKASAKQKLMNGEALTEDEANVMVGL